MPINVASGVANSACASGENTLVDVANPANIIVVGDTSYFATGLYTAGAGVFSLAQSGNGISVNVYKEYRLTITGTSLTFQRGDTLANLTETRTATLPASIVGKTFHLAIGTPGTVYCPGTYDWIRVVP